MKMNFNIFVALIYLYQIFLTMGAQIPLLKHDRNMSCFPKIYGVLCWEGGATNSFIGPLLADY